MKVLDGYLNARQAAAYVGYEPAEGTRSREDKQTRAFYEWARRHGVTKHRRGRCLLFLRADLDRAIGRSTDTHNAQTALERMADLARRHVAGETVHG